MRSVANLTRAEGVEFLALAPQVPVRTHVTVYPLERAADALDDLRAGRVEGSAVIQVADGADDPSSMPSNHAATSSD